MRPKYAEGSAGGAGKLRTDRGGVAQAARLPRQVAARVYQEETEAGEAVQGAGHHQALRRDRRLQLVPDGVLEVVALQAGMGVVVRGVDHERQIPPLGGRPERAEAGVGEGRACHGRPDLGAHRARLGGLAQELGGGVR
jgi:hypothetical protein